MINNTGNKKVTVSKLNEIVMEISRRLVSVEDGITGQDISNLTQVVDQLKSHITNIELNYKSDITKSANDISASINSIKDNLSLISDSAKRESIEHIELQFADFSSSIGQQLTEISSRIGSIEEIISDYGLLEKYHSIDYLESRLANAEYAKTTVDDIGFHEDSAIFDDSNYFLDRDATMHYSSIELDNILQIKDDVKQFINDTIENKFDHIEHMSDRLDQIECDLYDNDTIPAEFIKLDSRISKASKYRPSRKEANQFGINIETAISSLANRGFMLSKETMDDICDALNTNRILIIEGPTGTGKTTLAELLPKIFLGPNATHVRISIDDEVTIDSALGCIRKLHGQLGISLGFLTDAVISSIENKGNHWLILDEINRGDISSAFAPFLAALSEDIPYIEWEHMHFYNSNQRGKIYMPESFRIIGTMNSYDKNNLHQFSDAFKRRFGIVKLYAPNTEEESHVIYNKLSNKYSSSISDYDIVTRDIINITVAITLIFRNISYMQPSFIYQRSYIGTALLIKVCDTVVMKYCKDDNINISHAVETAYGKICLQNRTDWNFELCKMLLNKLNDAEYNIVANYISKLLNELVI